MLTAIKGYYNNGTIKLYEKPKITDSEVIITFIDSENAGSINLAEKGFNKKEVRELKNRLHTFEEDWNAEGMELYDRL